MSLFQEFVKEICFNYRGDSLEKRNNKGYQMLQAQRKYFCILHFFSNQYK